MTVPDVFPERFKTCKCMYHKEIIRNVERGWPGLLRASKLKQGKKSELWDHLDKNLWVTSTLRWFKAHLRWCAMRKPPTWDYKVVSDVDLMRAWLGSVALSGQEIIDPDAAAVSMRHLTLLDLVEPPTLLVIRLGIKTAANKEMPNVLLETLLHRTHLDKPTWVFNDWSSPFDESMRSFSYEAAEYLSTWEHIERKGKIKRRARSQSAASIVHSVAEPDEVEEDSEETEDESNEMELESGSTQESKPKPPPKVDPVAARRARRGLSGGSGSARSTSQPQKQEKQKKKPWEGKRTRGKKA